MIYSINNKLQTINNGKLCDYSIYYPQNYGLMIDIYNGTAPFSAGITPFGLYVNASPTPTEHAYANEIITYTGYAGNKTSAIVQSNYYYNALNTAGENGTVAYIPHSGHISYTYFGAYPVQYWSAVNSSAWNSPFYYPVKFSGEYKLPRSLDIYVKCPPKAGAPVVYANVINLSSYQLYHGLDYYEFMNPIYTGAAMTGSATTAVQKFHFDITYPEVNNA